MSAVIKNSLHKIAKEMISNFTFNHYEMWRDFNSRKSLTEIWNRVEVTEELSSWFSLLVDWWFRPTVGASYWNNSEKKRIYEYFLLVIFRTRLCCKICFFLILLISYAQTMFGKWMNKCDWPINFLFFSFEICEEKLIWKKFENGAKFKI